MQDIRTLKRNEIVSHIKENESEFAKSLFLFIFWGGKIVSILLFHC